jgi:hypothetical protein
MEVINVDLIGPLPADRYGNELYILVIRDAFSRWTDLHALASKEATAVTYPLLRFFLAPLGGQLSFDPMVGRNLLMQQLSYYSNWLAQNIPSHLHILMKKMV